MAIHQSPISEEDYASIEAAVMETARGRWFLQEYAKRNRSSDTDEVLGAIRKLEFAMTQERSSGDVDRIRFDLADMATAIARTKMEIASIKPDQGADKIDEASGELDAIVKATETATGEILAAGEHLQEIAWQLRESGHEGATADIIEQRATDIYTACSFQDITGQRTRKVIGVLQYLEARLDAMLAIWAGGAAPPPVSVARTGEAALLNGPALPGQGLEQNDIDEMLFTAIVPQQRRELPVFSPPPVPTFREAESFRDLEPALEPAVVEPPALLISEPPISPFTTVVRPKAAKQKKAAPVADAGDEIRLSDIEALSFEEKAALFS